MTEARAQFSSFVDQAASGKETFEITRRGLPAAVLMSANDLEVLVETLAILSDPKLVQGIGKGLKDLESGADFDAKRVRADMRTDSS